MDSSRMEFFSFLISIQLCALTFVQSAKLFQHCSVNNTFKNNLNHLFSVISTDTEIDYGFYNVSYGQNPDNVNAIGMCRGDLKPYNCHNCIRKATKKFTESCNNHTTSIVWSDECMLRYSNRSLLGTMEFEPCVVLMNVSNATNVTHFNQVLTTLLDGLITQAASGDSLLKFASGNATVSNSETIYALAQCTPDLSRGL